MDLDNIPCTLLRVLYGFISSSVDCYNSLKLNHTMMKGGAKSKHNYDAVVSFIKQTTCFGPCTGPSSGLNLHVGGDYTVRVSLKNVVHYRVNEILLLCGTVMCVKL
jgi:hypothetical protein